MNELHQQLDDIKNTFVLMMFDRVRAEQFSQFQDWAETFMSGDYAAEEKLSKLLANVSV